MYNYKNYQKYFLSNENIPFIYKNKINSSDTSFKTGGLLNKSEYRISFFKNDSYLNNGIKYWITKEDNNYYAVDDPKKGISGVYNISNTNNYSTRVTEFIKTNTSAQGLGTKDNPLKLVEKYRVEFFVDSTKAQISPLVQYTNTSAGSTFNIIRGYKYSGNDCNIEEKQVNPGIVGSSTGSIWKYEITKDIKCTIKLKPITYKIKYDLQNGSYGLNHPETTEYDRWIEISNPTKKVDINISNQIEATITNYPDSIQEFDSWTISGMDSLVNHYYSNNKNSYNSTKTNTLTTNNTNFLNLTSIDESTITFTANWKDKKINLPTIKKAGYACSWTLNGKNYASGASYTLTDESTIQLVATCTECISGKYNDGNTSKCVSCDAGTYSSNKGSTSCKTCPKGSYSAAGSSSCTACQASGSTGTSGTTSAAGATSCNTSCGKSNVSTWKTATWSSNSVTNSCTISTCKTGYHLSSNSCISNTAKITINKNGNAYSGLTVALYSGTTSKYTSPTYSSGVYTFSAVANGTYNIYVDGSDTGKDITVSSTGTYTLNYYTVTLTKGTGISAVSGAGTYLSGTKVTLGATVNRGYTWSKWTKTSDGTQISTTKAYSATISSAWKYTANATITKVTCAAGKYLPANAKSCSNCTKGYYCTGGTYEISNTAQGITKCSNGKYQNEEGKSSCKSCPTSYSSTSDGTQCYLYDYKTSCHTIKSGEIAGKIATTYFSTYYTNLRYNCTKDYTGYSWTYTGGCSCGDSDCGNYCYAISPNCYLCYYGSSPTYFYYP